MNLVLLYLRVAKRFNPQFHATMDYQSSSWRFLASYLKFKPQIAHSLVVVNCGGEKPDSMFDGVADSYETYLGGGYDCGAYQEIGRRMDCDLVMGLNTHAHFDRPNWWIPFARAFDEFGPGVYGATASFERNPHLRTPAIGFCPYLIGSYPYIVTSRDEAAEFEAGPQNFSLWAHKNRKPSFLVTEDECYYMDNWRMPANGFRKGDQSDCLILDRHTDVWASASEKEREIMTLDADGFNRPPDQPIPRKPRMAA